MRLLFIAITLFLTSCVETAVLGTVATTGTIAAQERSAGQAVDDTSIFLQIKHHYLQENAQDLLAGVSVKVIEGRVYLTGNVNTTEASIDAVRLAWKPKGVKEVVNEINVNDEKTWKEIFKSRWIKAQVRTKILAEKDVRSINYSVEVVHDVVYLLGIAQNIDELDKVTNLARTVRGVEKVISHVRLKDDPDRAN